MATFIIGKSPDQLIIKAFQALSDEFGHDNWAFSGDTAFTEALELLLARKSPTYLITEAYIRPSNTNLVVKFRRTVNDRVDPYYDELSFEHRNVQPTPETLLRVEEIIRRVIKFPNPSAPARSEGQIVGLLEKEMSTIAAMHQTLLSDALELRKTYELQEAERRTKFEEEQREAATAIREHEEASLARIAEEKRELEAKIKEFDFSDHMRARRTLREQITSEVQRSLRSPISSFQSSIKLAVVALGTMAAAAVSAVLAYMSFASFITTINSNGSKITSLSERLASGVNNEAIASLPVHDNTYLLWLLAIRGFALSAVAVGFTYYLVSMFRKSYTEEIVSLREMQRYGMDINRASWIIETAMEMTTKENAKIPDKWIEGACSGLFQNGSSKDADVSSLAALGAVLGLGPEIDAGPDGVRLKIGPRASRHASKKAE